MRRLPGSGRDRLQGPFLPRLCLAALSQFDLPPDVVHNGRPGVGGEGQPLLRVKAQNGTPQADTTGLQGFTIRQAAQGLPSHDAMDQGLVRGHQSFQTVAASRLRLLEQDDPGLPAGVAHSPILAIHKAPPL